MKAIARITKLKGGSLAASEQHTNRSRETPNANPDRANQRLINGGDNEQTLADMIGQRLGQQKYRKDAVLCVEMLLSVSPEYFRPDNRAVAGYWETDKLERFQWAVQQWLTENYSDRVLRAELHLDEATPHVHAYIIPLDDRGKLNCKGLFGSREKLRQWQDSYAKALEPLGVERGIRGSRATHTAIQEYYAAVTEKPTIDLDVETMQHQVADRQRVLKERDEMAATARYLEKENVVLQQQVAWLQRQVVGMKVDTLTLEQVAEALCLEFEQGAWRQEGHQIRLNGMQFHDGHGSQMQQGNGAIDLVMHVLQVDFKSAVAWLHDRFGETAVQMAGSYHAQVLAQEAACPQFVLPIADVTQWPAVRADLVARHLPDSLLDQLHQQGLLYADERGAAIFVQRDLQKRSVTGAYRMSRDGWSGAVVGSDRVKGRFYWLWGGKTKDEVQRVVVAQTPIDVLAVGLTEPMPKERTMFLSVDGALPLDYLQSISPKRVKIAMNRDVVGRSLAEKANRTMPQVMVVWPEQSDWVESLRSMRKMTALQEVEGRFNNAQLEQ